MNFPHTVTSIQDIPDGEFEAVLENHSVFIPGDERSRTNPGHGYPAHTEHSMTMLLFQTRQNMIEWIEKQKYHSNFCVVKVKKIPFQNRVQISFE